MKYEVICGNIGSIYSGNDKKVAEERYNTYVGMSKSQVGRAGGEEVTLFEDGEPIREHLGGRPLDQYTVDCEVISIQETELDRFLVDLGVVQVEMEGRIDVKVGDKFRVKFEEL